MQVWAPAGAIYYIHMSHDVRVALCHDQAVIKSAASAVPRQPKIFLKNSDYISFLGLSLSTHIKDAGIAIRHSRGYIVSIRQGLEMGLREWNRCVQGHNNKLTQSNILF